MFKYLKSKLRLQNPDLNDTTPRLAKACNAFHKLKKNMKSKQYSLRRKIIQKIKQNQYQNSTLAWIRMSKRCKDRVERSRTFSRQMSLDHMKHH